MIGWRNLAGSCKARLRRIAAGASEASDQLRGAPRASGTRLARTEANAETEPTNVRIYLTDRQEILL